MKLLFCLFAFLSFFYGYSQKNTVNFSSIDSKAYNIESNAPDTLSYLLTSPYTNELEKVRSIFSWITEHISYNTVRYRMRMAAYKDDGAEADYDADSVFKTLDERVARITLKRRYALCDGYARLFKSLCDFANIKCVVITGYARTNFGGNQFRCNHKWNAVMIDSNWYLLDATWASGYISFSGDDFIKNQNDNYFLTSPPYFVQDHYPDDIKWTLMDNPPSFSEFNHSPFKQPAFNYKILSYSPSKGIINATVGDTVTIVLETVDDKKNLCLLDKSSIDSADIAFADSLLKTNKTSVISSNKISATYIVNSDAAKWLQVIYNSNVILRYKLNIKKQPFPYPPVIIRDIAINN